MRRGRAWERRRRAATTVACIVATLRSTLVLSTFGTACLSARRARYSCVCGDMVGDRVWKKGSQIFSEGAAVGLSTFGDACLSARRTQAILCLWRLNEGDFRKEGAAALRSLVMDEGRQGRHAVVHWRFLPTPAASFMNSVQHLVTWMVRMVQTHLVSVLHRRILQDPAAGLQESQRVWGFEPLCHLDGADVADVLYVLVDRRVQGHMLGAHRKALPVLRLVAAGQASALHFSRLLSVVN